MVKVINRNKVIVPRQCFLTWGTKENIKMTFHPATVILPWYGLLSLYHSWEKGTRGLSLFFNSLGVLG